MKKIITNLALILLFIAGVSCNSNDNKEISLLSLNIWQEGTQIEGGYDAIVNEIVRLNPDFVTLSEVRNYNDTSFDKRIVKSLAEKGLIYYSFKSFDSGLLSKYPIVDSLTVFPLKDDHGSIYKLTADVDGLIFAVYTAHLDYLNCAYYLPRGYDGNTWGELEKPVIDVIEIEAMNRASMRDEAIEKFIIDANKEVEKGSIVILGGDFNEPSNLDWTKETKDLYDHNGLVINWEVSSLLSKNNYVDAYRKIYPSAIKNPGFTYPSYNKDKAIDKLTWAPNSDERERIDFIYYKSTSNFSVKNITILGPSKSISHSKIVENEYEDKFLEPLDVWLTDHKGLYAVFEYID